jgi:hypothetical protein
MSRLVRLPQRNRQDRSPNKTCARRVAAPYAARQFTCIFVFPVLVRAVGGDALRVMAIGVRQRARFIGRFH